MTRSAADLGQEIAALIRDFAEARDATVEHLAARVAELEGERDALADALDRLDDGRQAAAPTRPREENL